MPTIISAVDTAKIARRILKEAFPSIKFRVRKIRVQAEDILHVEWSEGPNEEQVHSYLWRLGGYFSEGEGVHCREKRRWVLMADDLVHFSVHKIELSRCLLDEMLEDSIEHYKSQVSDLEGSEIGIVQYLSGELSEICREDSHFTIKEEIDDFRRARTTIKGLPSKTAQSIEVRSDHENTSPAMEETEVHDLLINKILNEIEKPRNPVHIYNAVLRNIPDDYKKTEIDHITTSIYKKLFNGGKLKNTKALH